MATKTKKPKAPAATKAAGFTDKAGHALAVGDRVQYDSPSSPHSGGKGTVTAIHERPASEAGPVASVLLDKLPTWKEAPTVPALPEALTWLETPAPEVPLTAADIEEARATPTSTTAPRRDGPWQDANGKLIQCGWLAKVLPDCSKALSGKLVNIIGLYDADTRTIEVQVLAQNEPFTRHRILPSLLEWVAGGESPAPVAAEPVPVEPETDLPFIDDKAPAEVLLTWEASDVLLRIREAGHLGALQPPKVTAAKKELFEVGLISFRQEDGAAILTETGVQWLADYDAIELPPSPVDEALEAHAVGLRVLPLASITITRNTRKVFDEAALAELAESIKAHGVLQPIVVRPAAEAGQYELVAGGRRYRAAELAGLAELPATVRTLTDREFLEVQLLENLQRVDVRPADEAQAFAELLRNGYSAEEIGLKVGKGEKFVLQRAKLASLIPFWFEALQEDRLPLVAGHELARLPAHSQLAVKQAVAAYYNSSAPRYGTKDISNYIHRVVLRELAQAPFPTDDATLVPGAGPCPACPKRSGACGLLFEVTDAKDTCLDATCYQSKADAFVKRRTAELTVEGKKPLLITSDYDTKDKNVLGTRLYTKAPDDYKGSKRVYEAVRVDGAYAGQVVRVTLDADTGKSDVEISNQKQVDAARLRKERHTKTHRVLIAEKLTADLPAALDQPAGPVFGAILDHLLLEVCSTSKDVLAYLREAWGWEPDEAALKNDYKGKDAQGFWPWQQYVRQAIRPLSWQSKLELYLAIKVRHRMHYDYEDAQFTVAKLIGGHGYPELDKAADEAVEARYYTKKGKKQEARA